MRAIPQTFLASALLLAGVAAFAAPPDKPTAAKAQPAEMNLTAPVVEEVKGAAKDVAKEMKQDMAPAMSAERTELLREFDEAQEKLAALAEAMPADKYSWRPGEGVRSVGEVFAHVAMPNFYIPKAWGGPDPDLGGLDMRAMQSAATDKTKVVEALKKSAAHAHEQIAKLSAADFDKSVDLFGSKTTVRGAVLILVTHGHEHLGQAIAYARMNGVVPPWTAAEQAAQGKKNG